LERVITESVKDKVFETIERVEHLVSLVPRERLNWRPEFSPDLPPAKDFAHLLGHVLDCMAGFCAAFQSAFPGELVDFERLRAVPVNEPSSPEQATRGIEIFATHIEQGFRCCSDADLGRQVPTVFVPEGETLLTLLLGNLEHLGNHKYQLFFHLKLAGVLVTSADLYRFRGSSPMQRP
jgi:hypothetical protein